MLFLSFPLLVTLFFCGPTIIEALNSSSTSLLGRVDSGIQVLTAITIRSELERRDVDFKLKYTLDHHYADRIDSPNRETVSQY